MTKLQKRKELNKISTKLAWEQRAEGTTEQRKMEIDVELRKIMQYFKTYDPVEYWNY